MSRDHVPPLMFFPKEIRRRHSPQLVTLASHSGCNRSFQMDEEYFVYALGPLAGDSYVGHEIGQDIARRFHSGRAQKLALKSLEEFDDRPSGLILPGDSVVKRYEGERVRRVLWKIVRGLHRLHYGDCISEYRRHHIDLVGPGEAVPEVYRPILNQQEFGQHAAVFAYKTAPIVGPRGRGHAWGMLFWDRIMAFTIVHGPDCACAVCASDSQSSEDSESGPVV